MTDTARPLRAPWSWPERVLYWLYGFFLGPFLTKHEDGTVTGAMTRWAVALFTAAMVYRLVVIDAPLGLADAFTIFFIVFALPIDGALTQLATRDPEKVLDLIARLSPGGAAREAEGFFTSPYTPPLAAGPGVLSIEDLSPPVAHGRPDDGGEP